MAKKSKAVSHTDEVLSQAFDSPLAQNAKFKKELEEVQLYYEYFDGFDVTDMNSNYGQTWKIDEDKLDYIPTREIRNHLRQLVRKQSRFMMSQEPELIFNPVTEGREKQAEDKRILFDSILRQAKFWSKAANALTDATVGKRVLMTVLGNEGEPVDIRFYPMPQFSYTVDPKYTSRLLAVDIVYQDERTRGMDKEAQLWHHYRYEMKAGAKESGITSALEDVEEECWLTYALTDGESNQIYITEEGETTIKESSAKLVDIEDNLGNKVQVPLAVLESAPTGLSQIPARVILNEPLTNDVYGNSDVKDLITIADNMNKTISDLRDALRFRMFEQPVIIDGSTKSLQGMKIAPNAVIDLKTDTSSSIGAGGGSRQAAVTSITSNFNFLPAVQYYLDEAKRAMYELMDQPLPEKVQSAPSGIAMQFLFYDLMSRCDSKWVEWDSAIEWMISMIEEILEKVPVTIEPLPEALKSAWQEITTLTINHNYPLPADELAKRQTAMQEVQTNVRSHQSYIEEFSRNENAEDEWSRILEEAAELEELSSGAMLQLAENESQMEDTKDEQTEEDETKAPEGTEKESESKSSGDGESGTSSTEA